MQRLFVITGPRGAGKSHLAQELSRAIANAVVFDDYEFGVGTIDYSRFVYLPSSLAACRIILEDFDPDKDSSDFILARSPVTTNEVDDMIQLFHARWDGLWVIRIDMGSWRQNPFLSQAFRNAMDRLESNQ